MIARLSILLLAASFLAACERPEHPPEPGIDRPDPVPASPTPPPDAADADYVLDALTDDTAVVEQPGEIIRLEPERVVGISVTGDGWTYDVDRMPERPLMLTQDGEPQPASAGAFGQLLNRYTPLEAQDMLTDVPAEAVTNRPTHRVLFHFDDESTRDVAFLQRGDFVAVVSRPEGPVYRLPAARLAELVPPPDAMR